LLLCRAAGGAAAEVEEKVKSTSRGGIESRKRTAGREGACSRRANAMLAAGAGRRIREAD
jgi:hypothetical protein